ncbi:MAG: HAMP domain-containing protein [Nitrospinae bacterium]|nr:HAMP domain-containing protein [Nitrospinota bacterium]
MKRIKKGLRKEIVTDITILLVAALLIVGIILLKVTEHLLIEYRSQDIRVMVSSIENSISIIMKNNPITFKEIMKESVITRLIGLFTREGGFSDLSIVDNGLTVLASSRGELIGKTFKDPFLLKSINNDISKVRKEKGKEAPFFLSNTNKLIITSPIYIEGRIMGGIRGEMSLLDLRGILINLRGLTFLYIIVDALIFIIFGGILLSKSVVRPIQRLVEATERVSNGDLGHRVKVEDDNEIGRLSYAFNQMTERLREKTESLERHIDLLKKRNIELKEARDEIMRSERLAAIGRMASGVAHEIGNPLGAINGYINILSSSKERTPEDIDSLRRIEKEVDRIDEIVRGLLNLATPPNGIITDVDINQILRESVELLRNQKAFHNIGMTLNLSDKIPYMRLDGHKIEQVAINLLLNSADAMVEGREKRIVVSSEIINHGSRDRFSDDDKQVRLTFSDTGEGIREEDISRIFDPFFTTKEPGKGTGLGLSICHRIIEDMGGRISVSTNRGEGTSFEIVIPVKERGDYIVQEEDTSSR